MGGLAVERASESAAVDGLSIPGLAPDAPADGAFVAQFSAGADDDHGPIVSSEERDETEIARAQEYTLLSALLIRAPDADMLARVAQLRADATPLGLAHAGLAEAASRASVESVEREYFNLFIGLGRGELMPYGSFYLTGFLHDRPLARLRAELATLGVARAEGNVEPEDHAAILCEIMAGLASGRFPAPLGLERQFFEKHLAPWIGRFFSDLERSESAAFYRHVGSVGRVFAEIEAEAFALPT